MRLEPIWIGLAALLVAFVAFAVWVERTDSAARDAACRRMWAAARTSADTVAVIARCELPAPAPTVVPMPIIVGGGR